MSFDRKIDQLCTHRVTEEALFMEDDYQTVRPLRPIASVAFTVVRVNGVATVPTEGVQLSASVVGAKPGPFTITEGVNDRLILSIDGGADQILIAEDGKKIPVKQVVRNLNGLVRDGIFEEVGPKVSLRTGRKGKHAFLHIKNGSTLASVLGLVQDRVFRGVVSVPGWSIVRDPNTLDDRPSRLVVFDKPLRGFADYVELNYTTIREECRRCGGLGVENDWVYGRTGNTIEVRDEALLLQEILKIMFTLRGSNPFHPWYGTLLTDTIGRKLSAGGIVQNLIVSEITTAFSRWQDIKRQQEESVGQFVSDREFPFQLLNVRVEQSTQDPTVIFVTASVQNRSGQPIDIERGIRLPEPSDLLGATAAQGVFRASLSSFSKVG
jgi:phage baseplate assembly protein W